MFTKLNLLSSKLFHKSLSRNLYTDLKSKHFEPSTVKDGYVIDRNVLNNILIQNRVIYANSKTIN